VSVPSYAGNASLMHGDFVVKVAYDNKSIEKSAGSHFLYGEVNITNTGSAQAAYSNKFLFISVDGDQSRTYKDTTASDVVDFSTVSVPAGGEVKFKAYWVFPSHVSTEGKTVTLQWHE